MQPWARHALLSGLLLCVSPSFCQSVSPPCGSKAEAQGLERIDPRAGVSAPAVLHAPKPDYSEEARQKKKSGVVLIYLQVGADGLPSHVCVLKGTGYGLDEKAVEAVNQYRFTPSMKNGEAVPVEMHVEVHFQLHRRFW